MFQRARLLWVSETEAFGFVQVETYKENFRVLEWALGSGFRVRV